jgi:CubicO group peptidase (beta-lactamase class C family)
VRPVNFRPAAAVIEHGLADRAFPAAVVEVGSRAGPLWQEAFGRLTFDPDSSAASVETVFDLASLTKVLATSTVAMRLLDTGSIRLTDRVSERLPEWRGQDREAVTLRDLLAHSSGLTNWLPFYRDYSGRSDFQQAICSLPLEYIPGSQSIYSDLGFILLAFVLEDAGRTRFDQLAISALSGLTSSPMMFNPPPGLRPRIAPTKIDPWRGRLLVGEVDDENCWALGGAAGHAGLFGTAIAIGDVARLILAALKGDDARVAEPDTVRTFVTRAGAISSRALGWDTMLSTSSCGSKMSARAFGHTGFTGTSLWIDPEADVYVVLLTNRVHPTRENTMIQQIRPAFHDAVMGSLSS